MHDPTTPGPVTLRPEEMARLRAEIEQAAPAFLPALLRGVEVIGLAQTFFRRHRILSVQASRAFPARQIHVACSADGAFHVLTAHLPHLNAIAAAEPPEIPDEQAARAYMNLGDFWTTESELGELVISAFAEIPFLPDLHPGEEALIDTLRAAVAADIGPPLLTRKGGGYVLRKWLLANRCLVLRELRLSASGQLERTDEVLDQGLPVHPGHLWGLVNDRLVPIG